MPKSGAAGKRIDTCAGFVAYESPATESIRREGIDNEHQRRIMLEADGKSGACTLFSALGAGLELDNSAKSVLIRRRG